MPVARSALRVTVAHAVYGLLMACAVALALPLLLLRARRDPRHARLVRERFGRLPPGAPTRAVWVHAVSVGEVKASRSLIAELRRRDPGLPVVLSTATVTGHATARAAFPDLYVFHVPLDLAPIVRRVFAQLRPRLLLLVELEVWPALLKAADAAGTPIAIVNGRITERSFRGYRRWRWFLPEFERLALVAAQEERYGERLVALGVPAARVVVTGNLKHDRLPEADGAAARALARELDRAGDRAEGALGPLIVAGSTHPGEERAVLEAWQAVGGAERAELVLVPRHVERCDELERELQRAGRTVQRLQRDLRGARQPRLPGAIVLVDVMGELETLFRLADVVFLGGSLVPIGGHNVLEPALAGRPQLVGPQLENCRREAEALAAAGGLRICADSAALARELGVWLQDGAARKAAGASARRAALALSGAARSTVDLLFSRNLLDRPKPAGDLDSPGS